RVVARLDLDVRERLQERRLAGVRRADERDLSRPLAPHGDRVTVDDPRTCSRRVDLGVHPLADVRVRAAAVAGKVVEDRAQLADARGERTTTPGAGAARADALCARAAARRSAAPPAAAGSTTSRRCAPTFPRRPTPAPAGSAIRSAGRAAPTRAPGRRRSGPSGSTRAAAGRRSTQYGRPRCSGSGRRTRA